MHRSTEIEIKVGIFVALGLGLTMMTILFLGGGRTLFSRNLTFHTKFAHSEGLIVGANVRLAGVKVGQVKEINVLPESNQVDVIFTVNSNYKDSVREDSTVGVQTMGVLGDRYVVINMGTPGNPIAKNGAELPSEEPKDLKDYLSNADQILEKLKGSLTSMDSILTSFKRDGRADVFFKNMSETSKNARASTDHLRSIMAKVDNGHGTLGALINDPSLYDDLKALLGGANRNKVLKYFIRKSVEESRDAAKESAAAPAPLKKKKKQP